LIPPPDPTRSHQIPPISCVLKIKMFFKKVLMRLNAKKKCDYAS
jgi:hypothetical protein